MPSSSSAVPVLSFLKRKVRDEPACKIASRCKAHVWKTVYRIQRRDDQLHAVLSRELVPQIKTTHMFICHMGNGGNGHLRVHFYASELLFCPPNDFSGVWVDFQ